jgi:hypothetical protein
LLAPFAAKSSRCGEEAGDSFLSTSCARSAGRCCAKASRQRRHRGSVHYPSLARHALFGRCGSAGARRRIDATVVTLPTPTGSGGGIAGNDRQPRSPMRWRTGDRVRSAAD